jgi:hypothetical protein
MFGRQRVVHGQRTSLAGFVFDGGQHLAIGVQQLQGGQVADGGELFESFCEVHGRDHGMRHRRFWLEGFVRVLNQNSKRSGINFFKIKARIFKSSRPQARHLMIKISIQFLNDLGKNLWVGW